MNLISIRKNQRPAIALLLCTGLLGACPLDAVADAGDRLPSPEIQQSKSPVKRMLVGTVTDASRYGRQGPGSAPLSGAGISCLP